MCDTRQQIIWMDLLQMDRLSLAFYFINTRTEIDIEYLKFKMFLWHAKQVQMAL